MDVNRSRSSSSSIISYMNNNTGSFAIQESSEEGDDQGMMMMDMEDMRRGPWTLEEDHALINYISNHGEGRWNSLARCAGLKRTGKSCRLRWLNYLRPDVRRGNITLEEQLMILELHSRWGNRWSKIAQHLPGRTDNEIKNYWRTRVQKHAKQLKCDVNSKQFKDTMKYLWMPRLMERIQAAASASTTTQNSSGNSDHLQYNSINNNNNNNNNNNIDLGQVVHAPAAMGIISSEYCGAPTNFNNPISYNNDIENSCDSFGAQVSPISDLTDNYNHNYPANYNTNPADYFQVDGQLGFSDTLISPCGYYHNNTTTHGIDFEAMEQNNQWSMDGGDLSVDNLWNVDDFAFVRQQFNI